MDTERESPILVDGSEDAFEASFLERIGHPVLLCDGPGTEALCPLLGGDGCEKFEHAHGVVFELDLDRAQHRAILERYRQLATEMPIRVVVRSDQAATYAALLEQFEVWTKKPTVADLDGLAAEVEAADRFAR